MLHRLHKKIVFFIILATATFSAGAQLTVTTNSNPLQLAQKILGTGVTIMNPQFTGNGAQAGIFKKGLSPFPLDSGIVLTTGYAKTTGGNFGVDNTSNIQASTPMGGPGDVDLGMYAAPNPSVPLNTMDVCALEFDFIPQGDSIYIRYFMASEEYPEFGCQNVNDAFAFLISGPGYFGKKMISTFRGITGDLPVAINTINSGNYGTPGICLLYGNGSPYTQYYVDNLGGQENYVYDGRTIVLVAKAKVNPCQTYHIKLVIGDVGDRVWDSGVFIEANSFMSKKEITTETQGPYTDPLNNNSVTMIEACKSAQVKLTRNPEVTGAFSLNTSYAGTAAPNIDFNTDMPPTVTFSANENQKIYNFSAIADPMNEGLEKIVVRFSKGTCTTTFVDSAILFIRDSLIYRSKFDTSLCTATPITIKAKDTVANVVNSYSWSSGQTTQSITVGQPGTYIATHIYSQRCLDVDTFNIVSKDPSWTTNNLNQSICPGDTATLSVTSNANLTWNTGALTPSIKVTNGGQYWVAGSNAAGCSKSDTFNITVKPQPMLNLGSDTSICADASITLWAEYAASSYNWSTGSTAPYITVNTAGTYSVISTLDGCSSKDTIVVGTKPLPTVYLGVDTSICSNASIQLNATYTGASYSWSNGATSPTITVNTAGNYSVINTLNGCVAKDTIAIATKSPPALELGADRSICQNDTVHLDASYPGATYAWSNGATSSMIITGNAGKYVVTSSLTGCDAKDSINVVVKPLPTVYLGIDTSFCDNTSVTLNAFYAGASYAWSTGATTSSISVSNAGTYSVINTLNSCVAKDTINITTKSAPLLDLGPARSICDYDSTLLDATYPGATYAWSTGSNAPSIIVTKNGTYSVISTLSSCPAYDTISISYKKEAVANAGLDAVIPQNTTTQLHAQQHPNNATYLWSPGATLDDPHSPDPIASPTTQLTQYILHVVSVDGCVAEDTVKVNLLYPLSIPNAFSPNGDNINDKWIIRNIEFYSKSRVHIFNRYGQEVYSESGLKQWDGTNKGKPLEPATYYYVIDTGEGHKFTGWILLLR